MKDMIFEYIWFGISVLGTMLGLSIVFSMFFTGSSTVSNVISVVLEELM